MINSRLRQQEAGTARASQTSQERPVSLYVPYLIVGKDQDTTWKGIWKVINRSSVTGQIGTAHFRDSDSQYFGVKGVTVNDDAGMDIGDTMFGISPSSNILFNLYPCDGKVNQLKKGWLEILVAESWSAREQSYVSLLENELVLQQLDAGGKVLNSFSVPAIKPNTKFLFGAEMYPDAVDLALTAVNPSKENPAHVSLQIYWSDAMAGERKPIATVQCEILPRHQKMGYLSQLCGDSPEWKNFLASWGKLIQASMEIVSDQPIAVTAIRKDINSDGGVKYTSVPVFPGRD
jgi:hypothetical protein